MRRKSVQGAYPATQYKEHEMATQREHRGPQRLAQGSLLNKF